MGGFLFWLEFCTSKRLLLSKFLFNSNAISIFSCQVWSCAFSYFQARCANQCPGGPIGYTPVIRDIWQVVSELITGTIILILFRQAMFLGKCSRKHHTFSTISLNPSRARQMVTVSRQRSGLNKTRKYCELKLHISLLINWKYYSTESRLHLRCNRNNNVIYFATYIILALVTSISWWRHQMEIFSALLSFCEGNPQETGGFPSQRPVTRSFDVFFDLWVKRVSKQSRRRWFETPWRSLWRHCYVKMLCPCLW